MAYEIVQSFWKRFTSIFAQEVHQKMMLAAGVSHEVERFASNFKAILAVLNDAQAKEMEESGVREWLNKVKDISYDMDDVLDEYNTTFLKLQNEKVEKALNFKVKVCFFFYFPHIFSRIVSLCRHIAIKIKEMNKRLDAVAKDEQIMGSLSKGIERFELKLEHFGSISPSHLSSYNSLPSEVKQCLLYCAIFPMGYMINKDHLIRLWMAQGYLGVGHNKEMEIVSQKYLDNIKTSSFFQEFEKDGVGNVISYKIDDTVHDFLQILCKDECFKLTIEGNSIENLNIYSFHEKICHFTCFFNTSGSIQALQFVRSIKRLRSLFINTTEGFHNSLTSHVLPALLRKFTCLRALSFSTKESLLGQRIPDYGVFPKSNKFVVQEIGKLVHLRYLKISDINIRNLPETLYELYNLQYLDLEGCENFEELPQDIRKLINLRYLNLCKLKIRSLPEILCELYNLQTLELGGCEKLEKLPHGLGKLTKLKYLNLCKSQLRSLPEILSDLHNLETLDLGDSEKLEGFPQGMGKLTNLRYLNLCKSKLRSLPEMLSELHNLETLDLGECKKLEELPQWMEKLIKLRHLNLCKWKQRPLPEILSKLYNLETLNLGECEKLEEFPQGMGKLTNLKYLNLCKLKLRSLPEMLSELYNLETLDLSECEELEELPQWMGKLINLRYLNLYKWKLRSLPEILSKLYNLEILNLGECENLEELPQWMEKLTKLRYLNLCKSNLIAFPPLICKLYNLQSLDLGGYKGYVYLPEGVEKLTKLRYLNLESLKVYRHEGDAFPSSLMISLVNLRELRLSSCRNYKHLPPLGKLMVLESLYIGGMESVERVGNEFWGIESDITSSSLILFPKLKSLEFQNMSGWKEWDFEIASKREEEAEEEENVTIMPSLTSLKVLFCPKLKALPDCLRQSTKLKELRINGRLILEDRYRQGKREDWAKISHIPTIRINMQRGHL